MIKKIIDAMEYEHKILIVGLLLTAVVIYTAHYH